MQHSIEIAPGILLNTDRVDKIKTEPYEDGIIMSCYINTNKSIPAPPQEKSVEDDGVATALALAMLTFCAALFGYWFAQNQ